MSSSIIFFSRKPHQQKYHDDNLWQGERYKAIIFDRRGGVYPGNIFSFANL